MRKNGCAVAILQRKCGFCRQTILTRRVKCPRVLLGGYLPSLLDLCYNQELGLAVVDLVKDPNPAGSLTSCTLGGNVMGGFRVSGHVMKRAPGVHQKAV